MLLHTDYHCHLLPGIDDGSPSAEVTSAIINKLSEQGITRVIATPHFVPHSTTTDRFIERRELAYERTLPLLPDNMTVELGAEVLLEPQISEIDMLPLTMNGSRYILIEFPITPLKRWMTDEIDNIRYGYSLTPVIAHVDRYMMFYKKDDYEKILEIEDAVFQFSNAALSFPHFRRVIKNLIASGVPVIFGSDAHNATARAPDFHIANKYLPKLLGRDSVIEEPF